MPIDPVTASVIASQGPGLLAQIQSGGGVLGTIGIGASYNPSNGGEIRRQCASGYNPPWPSAKVEAYIAWCRQYAPAIVDGTQSQWGPYAFPSSSWWGDRYDRYGGATLDRNGEPVPGSTTTGATSPGTTTTSTATASGGGSGSTQGSSWIERTWATDTGKAGIVAVALGVVALMWYLLSMRKSRKRRSRKYRRV